MRAVCGSSWHSKLSEPVDIWEPNRLNSTECGRVGTLLVPTGESERLVRVLKGPHAMHRYVDTGGGATLFEGVVDCTGSELQVGGR